MYIPSHSHRLVRPGFTLVEILVVIVIIATLAAIIFTGARRMMDTAKTTTTVANLKSLQTANSAYAVDNNGVYVTAFTGGSFKNGWKWNSKFLDCLGVTATGNDIDKQPVFRSGFPAQSAIIGYNCSKVPGADGSPAYFWSKDANLGLRLHHLERPEMTVAFVDCNDWWVNPDQWNSWKSVANDIKNTVPAAVAYRNRGKAAAVTFGGNVVMLERKDLDKSTDSGKWRWWYNGKS